MDKAKRVLTDEQKARKRQHAAKYRAAQRNDPEYKRNRKTPTDEQRVKECKRVMEYHNEKKKDPEYVKRRRELSRKARTTVGAIRLKLYKVSAKKKHREFSISDDAALSLFDNICHYCGNKKDGELNGIDRYDNDKDYPESNCVPCCYRCNKAKNDMSAHDFFEMCMAIAARQLKDTGWMENLQEAQ